MPVQELGQTKTTCKIKKKKANKQTRIELGGYICVIDGWCQEAKNIF